MELVEFVLHLLGLLAEEPPEDGGVHAAHLLVAQVERHLQVVGEGLGELRIELQHLEQVIAHDLVQVAVGERAHVTRRLADRGVDARVLAEDVVLACESNSG